MRNDRYLTIAILLVGALALAAFTKASTPTRFSEIAVERINIVEPDGTLRMTISDAARSPGWIFHGKPYPGRSKSAGMIFFNDEGEEDGGIGFEGRKVNGKVAAGGGMAFDQYEQDETVTLRYSDDDGHRRSGLSVADRGDMPITEMLAKRDAIRAMPAGPARDSALTTFVANNGHPLAAQRLFAGRDPNKNAVINLSDPQGHPRLRLVVDSTGAASIQFLDAAGRVTKTVSP
ncbi:MAG TPA: hypothetical protein VNW46_08985 [Gemmatimonadaceae bacterium]|nr:hypothetical protein [Gemmatimonadaceae bacterium]